jgi:hypothetical protein
VRSSITALDVSLPNESINIIVVIIVAAAVTPGGGWW